MDSGEIGSALRSAERSERSERSGADLNATARNLPVGRAAEPEVASTARRRRFPSDYKLRILSETDRCRDGSEIALLLRREGLYSHYLYRWRKWRREMSNSKDSGVRNSSSHKALRNENARLNRENQRLQLKLKKAEALLDLQKKVSEMLQLQESDSNGSSL